MAGNNIYNDKDSMDINELAALNDDISPELIEQLQQRLTQDAETFNKSEKEVVFDENDDTTLFEEPKQEPAVKVEQKAESQPETTEGTPKENKQDETTEANSAEAAKTETAEGEATVAPEGTAKEEKTTEAPAEPVKKEPPKIETNFDDNFIKKYKAKLDKQKNGLNREFAAAPAPSDKTDDGGESGDINKLTNGNITEKTITQAQKIYNDSLDLLDGNVKYSKYVIYIDPQNVDFIEGLTVKERKNLINKIIREQDDISITRKRLRKIRNVFMQIVVAILAFSIFVPIIYTAINASLEASINNYRRSQSNWQTLYRENGKINSKQQ